MQPYAARTIGRADDEGEFLHRLVYRRDDTGGLEDLPGAVSHPAGFRLLAEFDRVDEYKPGKPHGRHGPGNGADVAGHLRFYENDVNAGEKPGSDTFRTISHGRYPESCRNRVADRLEMRPDHGMEGCSLARSAERGLGHGSGLTLFFRFQFLHGGLQLGDLRLQLLFAAGQCEEVDKQPDPYQRVCGKQVPEVLIHDSNAP